MKKFAAALAIIAMTALPALAKGYTISFNQIVEHPALDALRKGVQDELAAQGFEVSYNIHVAQGNISTANLIARQILGENPDLVVSIATPTSQACAQVIKKIPIVFAAVSDPVGAGLVPSLEKPGGNITGTTDMSPVDRQVDLIREFLPGLKRLGVIYNSGEANSVSIVKALKQVCDQLGITLEEATIANSAGVYQAAKSLVGRSDAVYIPTDNTVVSAFEAITKVGYESKLPIFAADVDSVGRGAIAALAVDYYQMGRQTGEMAARVLKGADTAGMPVETLREFQIHLNPASAKKMGVEIAEAMLKRADKIVE
ncbi:ABC transporter substrate-binding protein [Desulfuromonas versatilis]|uniref:ABC transporter substrate-binding protein n=1 Tax=Desulfuromonas versatilis TaxID=2802975 RepID=A0ABN6DT89_9BACT|nr:ABC transporter substrate-binding protein [Desulfuromonas versatilis]BCR03372.1 ABC transporter substrate-binding protein [Desulfuromonas versatilis]